jgi:hypothetical protein
MNPKCVYVCSRNKNYENFSKSKLQYSFIPTNKINFFSQPYFQLDEVLN